jgi:O-antigen/teichoic acid export membrane protein
MIMLVSSGLVGGLNLLYNLAIVHELGAVGFGHASAVYTVLMLLSSVHLSFQLLCSKFVARNATVQGKIAVYCHLFRRAGICAIAVGALLSCGSSHISAYLNLPTNNYVVMLALAAVFYIPLGVRRGLMQGLCNFRRLAGNFVLEASVKVSGAFFFLKLGWGVSGVIAAVVASEVLAYAFSAPRRNLLRGPRIPLLFPVALGEGLQACLFFAGQVMINNLDIALVKHFFTATDAGVYAAVALVGRVVYMLSWSVVSAMFPFSAGISSEERDGRAVLGTAFALAATISALFVLIVWASPASVFRLLLGGDFPLNAGGSYRALLVLYAATTGIYALGVVLMSYEISRKIGNVGWVQLAFSGAIIVGIYFIHGSLHDVIMVQTVLLTMLLFWVSLPFLHSEIRRRRLLKTIKVVQVQSVERGAPTLALQHSGLVTHDSEPDPRTTLTRVRRVSEAEAIAEFLKGEFYQQEFDSYREQFRDIVMNPDLRNNTDNQLRRALLYRRRGRLWREIPTDTEWWEVELQNKDLRRVRVFPRDQWRKHSDRRYYLLDTAERIARKISWPSEPFIGKLRSLCTEFLASEDATRGTVLLVGLGDSGPLTIIEDNHRLTAAVLVSRSDAHLHFRFLCGFSPHMMDCCWYHTSFRTLLRYAVDSLTWLFDNSQDVLDRAVQNRLRATAAAKWSDTPPRPARSIESSDSPGPA